MEVIELMSPSCQISRATPLTLATVLCAALAMGPSSLAAPASRPTWLSDSLAQRDFVTDKIFVDRMTSPGRVWLISASTNGVAHAVEFFSGEKIASVQFDPDGKRITFSDAHGHSYNAVKARALTVSLGDPSSYAGWQEGERGHEVILGAQLAQGASDSRSQSIESSPASATNYFNGEASCDPAPYVVRTQGSAYQPSEPGFVGRTKILADFDKARSCWTSKPLQAVNLEDNTFLLVMRDRVFRIDSKYLMPTGSAPDLKVIDINEK
jgi:hypothetical protein